MKTAVLRGVSATVLCAAIITAGAAVMTARAQIAKGSQSAPAGKITPWEAIKIANGRVPGRALNANFEFEDGHWIYGVIVVSGKTLKEIEIDANSGKIGDVESITPGGEAKEFQAELTKALGGKATAASKKGEKAEKE